MWGYLRSLRVPVIPPQLCASLYKSKEASMPNKVRPIPEGYQTITPQLTCRDAARAIEFYRKVLGAQELMRSAGPDGKIMHAELQIGDSRFMLNDEFPGVAVAPN